MLPPNLTDDQLRIIIRFNKQSDDVEEIITLETLGNIYPEKCIDWDYVEANYLDVQPNYFRLCIQAVTTTIVVTNNQMAEEYLRLIEENRHKEDLSIACNTDVYYKILEFYLQNNMRREIAYLFPRGYGIVNFLYQEYDFFSYLHIDNLEKIPINRKEYNKIDVDSLRVIFTYFCHYLALFPDMETERRQMCVIIFTTNDIRNLTPESEHGQIFIDNIPEARKKLCPCDIFTSFLINNLQRITNPKHIQYIREKIYQTS